MVEKKKIKKLTKSEQVKVVGGAAAAKGKAKPAPSVHANGIVADAKHPGKALARPAAGRS